MTPGIKRLYHQAWPSLCFLFRSTRENPIRPGGPRPCELTRTVVLDPAPWERKTRWDRKSVVPEEEPSRASRCAIPQGYSREATR
jgi:hypothetical protein